MEGQIMEHLKKNIIKQLKISALLYLIVVLNSNKDLIMENETEITPPFGIRFSAEEENEIIMSKYLEILATLNGLTSKQIDICLEQVKSCIYSQMPIKFAVAPKA